MFTATALSLVSCYIASAIEIGCNIYLERGTRRLQIDPRVYSTVGQRSDRSTLSHASRVSRRRKFYKTWVSLLVMLIKERRCSYKDVLNVTRSKPVASTRLVPICTVWSAEKRVKLRASPTRKPTKQKVSLGIRTRSSSTWKTQRSTFRVQRWCSPV